MRKTLYFLHQREELCLQKCAKVRIFISVGGGGGGLGVCTKGEMLKVETGFLKKKLSEFKTL